MYMTETAYIANLEGQNMSDTFKVTQGRSFNRVDGKYPYTIGDVGETARLLGYTYPESNKFLKTMCVKPRIHLDNRGEKGDVHSILMDQIRKSGEKGKGKTHDRRPRKRK